jgi:hypothetical protein
MILPHIVSKRLNRNSMTFSRFCHRRALTDKIFPVAVQLSFVGFLLAWAVDVDGFNSPTQRNTPVLAESVSKIFGKISSSPVNQQQSSQQLQLLSSRYSGTTSLSMTSSNPTKELPSTSNTIPSWTYLQESVGKLPVGIALNNEDNLRKEGKGSAHVQNRLRKFGKEEEPQITFFRDHAGWYVVDLIRYEC